MDFSNIEAQNTAMKVEVGQIWTMDEDILVIILEVDPIQNHLICAPLIAAADAGPDDLVIPATSITTQTAIAFNSMMFCSPEFLGEYQSTLIQPKTEFIIGQWELAQVSRKEKENWGSPYLGSEDPRLVVHNELTARINNFAARYNKPNP